MALILLSARTTFGQVLITGTVYDESQRFAMAGVSVLSTLGLGTTTDSTGHYHIRLALEDSIYFSYLGKSTTRFPVKEIRADQPFDMALAVSIDSLPAVFVRGNNYLLDSLQNRKDYAKVFNYQTSYLNSMKTGARGGLGVGLNLDMFLNAKQNRRMEAFQKRLEEEEKDKFVDHRFSRAIVRRVTGLDEPALDTFMVQYRPTQEFIQSCATEYEFYHYIQEWGKFFVEDWTARHPDIPAMKRSDSTAMKRSDSTAMKEPDSTSARQ
ncbi:MAG TPA: hypothetical protein VG052_01190 [Puia sp.]|nr:hypothetical protein [Puia sp.]